MLVTKITTINVAMKTSEKEKINNKKATFIYQFVIESVIIQDFQWKSEMIRGLHILK